MGRRRRLRNSIRIVKKVTPSQPPNHTQVRQPTVSPTHHEHLITTPQNTGECIQSPVGNITSVDKSWINIEQRASLTYVRGAMRFILFASNHLDEDGKITCPCRICVNGQSMYPQDVFDHIIWNGFLRGYVNWGLHGEAVGSSTPEVEINK
ncbi:hypothetical protein SLEP1_g41645 [Rubroshorea leprosula]|uniref:Transposase-associated domain-containing protein n=1 Tax=Rubroshorea leprosula TaxID=152421 RepID=A0AAV5L868_9ROSI|nr:hypothetical protein SLEP1_g41645 [Rubroshorea leprosula]